MSSLVNAMEWFCLNRDSLKELGIESRNSAERFFDCVKSDQLICDIIFG